MSGDLGCAAFELGKPGGDRLGVLGYRRALCFVVNAPR
jgi:hypothetical protein